VSASKTHRISAALKLPTSVLALISVAKAIIAAMAGNASFPSPEPPLAVISVALNDLETAEAAALARTKGAATARNQKRAALVALLELLKAYVQKTADVNLATAATVIQSAAMVVRKVPVRTKRVFTAKQGTVSGSVTLVTASAARRASYEWQYSSDGGKTWQLMPATLQAKTVITGLQSGSTYMFRYRAVVKAGAEDWSQPLSFLVK
jgi:lysylphosphatidylglycerol synthetase-like protein (DUF2156 family)